MGFLDQATENPDFYKCLGSQIDSYITYLMVLHNQLGSRSDQEPNEKIYQPNQKIIDQTMELVRHLEKVEQERLGQNPEETLRACLNFAFAGENGSEEVLAKRFLSRIAALRGEKSVNSGSFTSHLQRKG